MDEQTIQDIDALISENDKKKAEIELESTALKKIKKKLMDKQKD